MLLVWGGTFVLPTFEGLNIAVLRLSFFISNISIYQVSRLPNHGIITFIPLGYLSSFNTTK